MTRREAVSEAKDLAMSAVLFAAAAVTTYVGAVGLTP